MSQDSSPSNDDEKFFIDVDSKDHSTAMKQNTLDIQKESDRRLLQSDLDTLEDQNDLNESNTESNSSSNHSSLKLIPLDMYDPILAASSAAHLSMGYTPSHLLQEEHSRSIHSNTVETDADPSDVESVPSALDDFLSFCRDNPPEAGPNRDLANRAQVLLLEVRKAVLFHGVPEELSSSSLSQYNFGISLTSTKNGKTKKPVMSDKEEQAPAQQAGELTTSLSASTRGSLWKALIMGPLLVARYANGAIAVDEDAPVKSDPSNLDIFASINNIDMSVKSSTADVKSSITGKLHKRRKSSLASTHQSEAEATLAALDHRKNDESSLAAPVPIYTGAEEYIALNKKGASARYKLIRDDSFRTFRTKERDTNSFLLTVPEQSIVRVCNAFDHKFAEFGWEYCQGMNVYAGVFLYLLPELDAFNVFSIFCTHYIPLYWKSNHIGVEAGCKLVDKVLAIVDPALYNHLQTRSPPLNALLYSFPFVKTMSATAPPLSEVLKLWDFQLAMGPHMSVFCVTAQLYAMRSELLADQFPKAILDYRKWPLLRARYIAALAMSFLPLIPSDLYRDITMHSTSDIVVGNLCGRSNYRK